MPVDVVARFFRLLTSLALGTLGTAKLISLGFVEPGSDWVGLLFGAWEVLLAIGLLVTRCSRIALALTVATCAGFCVAALSSDGARCSCMAGLVRDPGPGLRLVAAGAVGFFAVLGWGDESAG